MNWKVKRARNGVPGRALALVLACALGTAAAAPQDAAQPGTSPPAVTIAPITGPLTDAAAPRGIPRPPELQKDVNFWIRVYTEITTNEGFLHDEWDLSVVYAKMEFSVDNDSESRGRVVDETRDRYTAILKRTAAAVSAAGSAAAALASGNLDADEKRVIALWGGNPSAAQLTEATQTMRFQLGQADRFRAGLVRSGAWETHIAESLANLGLPPELAALPHVESSFNPAAYSKVGAAGLWQFMRSTGRLYLRVDDAVDERLDPFRSTEAAAQLLAYNYRALGTWPLALTAYNHGAAGMRRAKDAVGTDDIVQILRRYRGATFGFASRNFFVSFLAALTIDQNPDKYFSGIERTAETRFDEVEVPGYVRFAALERALGVPRAALRELNPALRPPVFDGSRLVPRGYRLRLPAGSGKWTRELLAARVGPSELFAGQIAQRSHRVKRGDTLASIAKRYGLSTRTVAELNGMQVSDEPRRGRVLRLPELRPALLAQSGASAAAAAAAASAAATAPAAAPLQSAPAVAARDRPGKGPRPAAATTSAATTAAASAATVAAASAPSGPAAPVPGAEGGVYVVRAGDTMFGIAMRFGLSAKELMRVNNIRDADYIFEGQRLQVVKGAPVVAAVTEPSAPIPTEVAAQDATQRPVGPNSRRAGRASAQHDALLAGGGAEPARAAEAAAAAAAAASGAGTAAESSGEAQGNAQAESPLVAQGPAVGPGEGTPTAANVDALDLGVARDNTIRVIAEETLGHYADWLGIPTARLRSLNKLKYGQAVLLGRKLKLEFPSAVPRELFEQRRREFHSKLQAAFFEQRRILGTEIYIVRRGDSLWAITQRYTGVPVWLLQQYNPDVELGELRPGSQLVIPKLEESGATPAASG
jgi:membrane-bound lytic murein transglycosylase D